ncbi:MAG: hypothetical protein PHN75_01995 [Syntrophales bacterium]|nr:hypothetical protein [Syntrophales bacterium]
MNHHTSGAIILILAGLFIHVIFLACLQDYYPGFGRIGSVEQMGIGVTDNMPDPDMIDRDGLGEKHYEISDQYWHGNASFQDRHLIFLAYFVVLTGTAFRILK